MGCQHSNQPTQPYVPNIQLPPNLQPLQVVEYATDPKQNDWRLLTSGSKFGLIQRIKASVKTPKGWRRLTLQQGRQCQKDIDRISDDNSVVAFDKGAYLKRQYKDVVKPSEPTDKFIVRVLPSRSPENK